VNASLRRLWPCLIALLFAALPSLAHAATLNVPSASYPTIQSGVNASHDGDTVLVADGTYSGPGNRDIDFNGKNITVTSQNGPTKTIIDCGGYASTDGSGNHRGFYIHGGEKTATISGFTVKNGYENGVSGIANSGSGGGIFNENIGGTITLTNCIVSGNSASDGGGISNSNSNSNGAITLTNCTVSGNTASYGGGISNDNYNYNYSGSGTITLTNCIFYKDVGGETANAFNGITKTFITYSDIQGGYPGTGNIDADPQFVNAANSDLHLKYGLPCIKAGTATGAPTTDLDGNLRPNPPSMGAYDTNASANPLLPPVLLVHGTWSNAQVWDNGMSQRLAKEGFIVDTVNFATEPETLSNETYIELQAKAIGRRVQELEDRTGQRHICMVCHSMGGLAARYYLEHLNLWPVHLDQTRQAGVDKLILLGTPNLGTDSSILDPVSTVSLAHYATLPLAADGYDSSAVDTYNNWSPAVKEQFAEWEPAPNSLGNGRYSYPDGYKLTSWPIGGSHGYQTPIQAASYAFADLLRIKFAYHPLGSDFNAVNDVIGMFAGTVFNDADKVDLDFYTQTAQQLGVLYPDTATTIGVNGRLISPFLKSLNTTPDTSGAQIYMIAGTYPVAQEIGSLTVVGGPFNTSLPNDGIVPTDSVFGIDPITGTYLYPKATRAIIGTYHTDLPKNPDVINQVVSWLKDVPINSKAHVLWNNTDGRVMLWSIAKDGTFTLNGFGPYTDNAPQNKWSATAVATGSDGKSHLLWNNTDGRVMLWTVDDAGNFTLAGYGPYTDNAPQNKWSATAVSVGPDNTVHLLWNNTDGRVMLWNVASDFTFTLAGYGPYTDNAPQNKWRATALATGPDGLTRIVWNNTDYRVMLWKVDSAFNFTLAGYGLYTDNAPQNLWSAAGVSVSPDNLTHLLWSNTDRRAMFWNVDASYNFTLAGYGPYTDNAPQNLWSATAVATGPDGLSHILWGNTDYRAMLWGVDNAFDFSVAGYGPYTDNAPGNLWSATAISAGP